MTAKKYRVGLTEEEQEDLKGLVSKGRAAAYRQTHARILLLSDENQDGGERTQQETLAPGGASWRGRWVGRLMGQWRTGGVRPGVESLAAGRGRG